MHCEKKVMEWKVVCFGGWRRKEIEDDGFFEAAAAAATASVAGLVCKFS